MHPAPSSKPTRVLLVEDEPADALAVRRSLRYRGRSQTQFAVEHAVTLTQGIAHLDRAAVDVLLLDLHLPDSDGPATVERLRERHRCVPLVAVTGDGDPELVARAFEAGADEYLVKCDMHTALLRRTIRHAIQRRRLCAAGAATPSAAEGDEDHRALLHDLKNLHTSILGNAQILEREMRRNPFLDRRLKALLGAARTAADLLRCAGKSGESERSGETLELSAFVRASEALLCSALAERAGLHLELAPGLAPVPICRDAMRRVVLELVVNAAEAIGTPGGGVVIRTGHSVLVDGEPVDLIAPRALAPGPYTWLEVADPGTGFDAAVRARLLEPGFSTKGTGRGHGLGQVQAILARYRGGLLVRSEPGGGATFRVLLPTRG